MHPLLKSFKSVGIIQEYKISFQEYGSLADRMQNHDNNTFSFVVSCYLLVLGPSDSFLVLWFWLGFWVFRVAFPCAFSSEGLCFDWLFLCIVMPPTRCYCLSGMDNSYPRFSICFWRCSCCAAVVSKSTEMDSVLSFALTEVTPGKVSSSRLSSLASCFPFTLFTVKQMLSFEIKITFNQLRATPHRVAEFV